MPNNRETASSSRSLANGVTAQIRQLIVSGELAPGKPIRARELKERFGVSHIPIREALRTLEGEGLVNYLPQRGAIATDVSADELVEIYELRRLIECHAAQCSAPRYDAAHLTRLDSAMHALEDAHAVDRHGEAFFAAHLAFHWLLLQPSASTYTHRVLQTLWQASRRYVHLSITTRPQSHGEHHRAIMAAARERDGEKISKLLEEHLRITEDSLTSALHQLP